MMTLLKKRFTLIMGFLLFINTALAVTPQNPLDLIQSTVNNLQQQISAAGPSLNNNPQKLYAIVKQTIMPYVAIDQMAGLALGPKWRTATPEQQQQFIEAFGLLLTKTYADALLKVSSYQITLNPLRDNSWQSAKYIAINGQVTSKTNGKSSTLTYYLEQSGNSWKIYDLAIEGVSFLKNYQDQFRSFQDMPSLLNRLNAINKQ